MLAIHAYPPRHAGVRSRALVLVVSLHLLLGWLLLSKTGFEPRQRPQPALESTLIQLVAVAPPALPSVPVARPAPAPREAPAPQPRPRLRESTAVSKTPVSPEPRKEDPVRLPATATAPMPLKTPAQPQAQTSTQPQSTAAPSPAAAEAAAPSPRLSSATVASPTPGFVPAPAPAGAAASRSLPVASMPSVAPAGLNVTSDVFVACPVQVEPVMPSMAKRGGVSGVVVAQASIAAGKVREVTIVSGLPVFHNAVRTAMLQYQCVSNVAEVTVTQEFRFGFK